MYKEFESIGIIERLKLKDRLTERSMGGSEEYQSGYLDGAHFATEAGFQTGYYSALKQVQVMIELLGEAETLRRIGYAIKDMEES